MSARIEPRHHQGLAEFAPAWRAGLTHRQLAFALGGLDAGLLAKA